MNRVKIVMSRLQNQPAPTMIEPESFEQEEELPAYQPEHPMLSFKRTAAVAKPDHLDQYIEVDPYAKREAAAEKKE
jgi:hypothetical protein